MIYFEYGDMIEISNGGKIRAYVVHSKATFTQRFKLAWKIIKGVKP